MISPRFLNLVLLSLLIVSAYCDEKTMAMLEICRHGHRAPMDTHFNNHDHLNQFWKKDQYLTAYGKMQHWTIGKHLRNDIKRENPTFFENFQVDDVYFMTTNVPRTIASLKNQILGFENDDEYNFADEKKPIINRPNALSAEEVEYLSDKLDHDTQTPFDILPNDTIYIFSTADKCFGSYVYKQMGLMVQNSGPVVEAFSKKYSEKLMAALKWTQDNTKNMMFDYSMTDAYMSDYYENFNLRFLNIDTYEFLQAAIEIQKFTFYGDLSPYTLHVNESGVYPFFQALFADFDAHIDKSLPVVLAHRTLSKAPFLFIYLSHDNYLAAIITTLHKYFQTDIKYIWFASDILFKLVEKDGEYFVSVTFNTEPLLFIKYKEFKDALGAIMMTPSQRADFCAAKPASMKKLKRRK